MFIEEDLFTIRALRHSDRGVRVAFEEIPDRSAADRIRGKEVFGERRRALGEGEYWASELIGLEVRETDGMPLGIVADVLTGEAQDRLVISGDSVFEVPFVEEWVPSVDRESRVVTVRMLPGLLSD